MKLECKAVLDTWSQHDSINLFELRGTGGQYQKLGPSKRVMSNNLGFKGG